MKIMRAGLILVLVLAAASAAADSPRATIEGPIDRVVALLREPRYAAGTPALREEQRQKIWDIVQKFFNYDEISARAVGQYWKNFSPEQRKVFSDAFSKLLGNTYIDRIQSNYHDEMVTFTAEEKLSDVKAVVRTKIVRDRDEIPVDYSLSQEGGAWRVYDVNVEGVSLVQNYRTQFSQILMKETPDQLIERVRKKNQDREKK